MAYELKANFLRVFGVFLLGSFLIGFPHAAQADELTQLKATVLVASNEGSDFNLVNDEFRDQLIELFSYTAYDQVDVMALDLPRSERVIVPLPEGYELILTLQEVEKERIMVQTLIRKGSKQYVYTVLSILKPGVVFVGGPPVKNGALIIVLENTGN